jgi:hypothetical protein
VYEWLCDEKKGKWVLILDNVGDADFLIKAPGSACDPQTASSNSVNSRPFISYLLHCLHGSTLITTRSRDAACKLVERRYMIAIDPMDSADAPALFTKKVGEHDDENTVVELVTALEYMPLAIVQAAACIVSRAPDYSVSQFEMHALVQLAMREWLKAHQEQERWKEQFVRTSIQRYLQGCTRTGRCAKRCFHVRKQH